jgi:hypothetical protein
MDLTAKDQQTPEESVTFVITKTTRNRFLAKIIILFSLSLLLGHAISQDNARQYQKGRELTREKYLENFETHKGKLMSTGDRIDPFLNIFIAFLAVSVLIGSYELATTMIALLASRLKR